jgi:hypothetical protein
MKNILIMITAAAALILGASASAQVIPPGSSQFNPPLPQSPPPPKIEVPVPPKIDELPQHNYVNPPGRSFGDKISGCLDQGAAAGLGPSDRAAYSRSCAHR